MDKYLYYYLLYITAERTKQSLHHIHSDTYLDQYHILKFFCHICGASLCKEIYWEKSQKASKNVHTLLA